MKHRVPYIPDYGAGGLTPDKMVPCNRSEYKQLIAQSKEPNFTNTATAENINRGNIGAVPNLKNLILQI